MMPTNCTAVRFFLFFFKIQKVKNIDLCFSGVTHNTWTKKWQQISRTGTLHSATVYRLTKWSVIWTPNNINPVLSLNNNSASVYELPTVKRDRLTDLFSLSQIMIIHVKQLKIKHQTGLKNFKPNMNQCCNRWLKLVINSTKTVFMLMNKDDIIFFFFTRKQTTFRRAQWNWHPATVPISKFLSWTFEKTQASEEIFVSCFRLFKHKCHDSYSICAMHNPFALLGCCYTRQFFLQLISQFCSDTSCAKNYLVWNPLKWMSRIVFVAESITQGGIMLYFWQCLLQQKRCETRSFTYYTTEHLM